MGKSSRTIKIVKGPPIPIRVKFLTDCDPEDGKPVFKKGSIHELSPPSANHWITRRKAQQMTDRPHKAERVIKPKKGGRKKKVEPIIEEPTGKMTIDEEAEAENAEVEEKPIDEEPTGEGKKTEDGESLGEIPDLMA